MVKTYAHLNLDYLEMMTGGDAEMRETMLGMIREELPTEIGKMGSLVASKNWNELKEVSHKMKSTLAFVGNDKMTLANREIEGICKNMDGLDDLAGLVLKLENELPAVKAELAKA